MYSTTSQFRLVSGLTTSEISDDNVTVLIDFSDSEIDGLFNRSFGDANSFTEYVSVYLPKRSDDIAPNRFILKYYPIQSITKFELVTSTSSVTATLATLSSDMIEVNNFQTADYFLDPSYGLVELNTRTIQFSPSKAKISGTYGYSETPTHVQELSAVLTAIRAWLNFLGGNYDRLNRYKLPEQEYDKGDFYDRGLKSIERLSDKANTLVGLIGSKYRSQLFSTSGGYF